MRGSRGVRRENAEMGPRGWFIIALTPVERLQLPLDTEL